jgi:hypothetical protein
VGLAVRVRRDVWGVGQEGHRKGRDLDEEVLEKKGELLESRYLRAFFVYDLKKVYASLSQTRTLVQSNTPLISGVFQRRSEVG